MPSANQRISEYVLDERVGAGSFGEVWRAHHHVWTDQMVAIKIPTDSQYISNLQREGRAVHGLVHPNIVRAIGFDPYSDPPYLVMEYVPGTSLRPLIDERKLAPQQAVEVLQQVLKALVHAHQNGLVHRDIKPENVLIHQRAAAEGYGVDGLVKVTDFGLGEAVKATTNSIAYSASLAGPEGQRIAGTLEYMSPEQRAGGAIDARADLYACGVMLFEMLTGHRPAGTEVPSELNPQSPRRLDELFRRSYARLEKRFGSAQEFLDALSAPAAPPPIARQGTPAIILEDPPVAAVLDVRAGQSVCPNCRRGVQASDQFCMFCGTQVVSQVRRCPRCGSYPDQSDRFCMFCGQALAAG